MTATSTQLRARGSKRKCQNDACSRHFYDLNRADVACPYCATKFDLALLAAARAPDKRYARRQFTLKPVVALPPEDLVAVDAIDAVDADGIAPDAELPDAAGAEELIDPEDPDEADDGGSVGSKGGAREDE